MNKRLTFWFVFLWCGPSAWANEPLKLCLEWYPSAEYAGILLAQSQGLYAKNGIDLKIQFNAKGVARNVEAHSCDIAMEPGGDLIRDVGQGIKVKAFAAHFQFSPQTILTRGEDEITSVAGLKGKTLGFFQQYDRDVYRIMLKSAGVDPSEVNFQLLKSYDEAYLMAALEKRQVDGFLAWEFHWPLIFSANGKKLRQFPGYRHGLYFYGEVFIAERSVVARKRNLLTRFLAATKAGWRATHESPEVALKLVLEKWYPQEKWIGKSRELTENEQRLEIQLSKRFIFDGIPESQYGRMTRLGWAKGLEVAKANQMLPTPTKLTVEDLADFDIVGLTVDKAISE